jgi:hypothetical protein
MPSVRYIRCHPLCPVCAIIAVRDWMADRLVFAAACLLGPLGLFDEGASEP